MQLAPTRASTLTDDCVRQLRGSILRGDVAVGDRLPPERQLAEQLGVNRVTVRAALARLAASGLVSVRQGQGYTVRDYRRAGGPDLLGVLAQLEGDAGRLPQVVDDLLLVRRQLARAVLVRLAERRPAAGPLDAAVAAFSDAVARGAGSAALALHEAEILAVLLELTGSPVLQVCLNPVRQVLAELPQLVDAMFRTPGENAAGWQALGEWVADPSAAGVDLLVSLLAARDADTVRLLGPS